eukprot:jgi/Astpho2/6298/Aster-x0723
MQAAAALMQNSLMVAIILLAGISLAGWKLHRPLRESIMVITGLAVVLETHTVCGMGSSAVLDAALIQDVIINEAVTTSKAFFYIAFILRGQRKMAVGFRRMRPRLHILQPAYRALLKELELPGADQVPS